MIMAGLIRLGDDAEVKTLDSGTVVVKFSGAFDYGKSGPDGRQTQWVNLDFYGTRAEKVAPYLTKGSQICVIANDPSVRTYTKKDGTQGFVMQAIVQDFEFAGGKKDATSTSPNTSAQKQLPASTSKSGSITDMEDDIPF